LRAKVANSEFMATIEVEPIKEVCRRNRLRWFGQVERKGDDDWVKRCTRMELESNRPRGRMRKTWTKMLEDVMTSCVLSPADAKDRSLWRGKIHVVKRSTRVNLDIS
jgi:hypothetical protein